MSHHKTYNRSRSLANSIRIKFMKASPRECPTLQSLHKKCSRYITYYSLACSFTWTWDGSESIRSSAWSSCCCLSQSSHRWDRLIESWIKYVKRIYSRTWWRSIYESTRIKEFTVVQTLILNFCLKNAIERHRVMCLHCLLPTAKCS